MSEQRKKNEKNFLVQGSILAIAGVITKLIGALYRIPLQSSIRILQNIPFKPSKNRILALLRV